MFGYLNVKRDELPDGQQGLWQTFMCGLCLSTKNKIGNISRLFVNNDVNTFNVLFHSFLNIDVEVYHGTCLSHPLRKRSLIHTTPITDSIAVANVILTRWNLYDDVIDGASVKKKVAFAAIDKSYKKARLQWQQMDDEIRDNYNALRQAEQAKSDSIDRTAHHFALLSMQFCTLTLQGKANQHIQTLCYNLGKWIYLVDALDDVEKDIKNNNYNPFVSCYHATSASQVATYADEIRFVMFTTLNRIAQAYNDLNLTKYKCLLDNIFYKSIRAKTTEVLDKLAATLQQ